jgi:antitoxin component YwqK of YwqJK toxin-antitoxin module
MRFLTTIFLLISIASYSQYKDYQLINDGKDTVNRIDMQGRKQGEWIVRVASLRGEPGYEEEGVFLNDRKEGPWRVYNLMGDLIGLENYRWGNKDGIAQYFNMNGQLRAEQSWKALNPDKVYDTIQVEDPDKLDSYHQVVVKNEGASLKHGAWKYYDENGALIREENYVLGKLEHDNTTAAVEPAEPKKVPKPKEVLEFEQQRKGKKKIRYQDGSTQ